MFANNKYTNAGFAVPDLNNPNCENKKCLLLESTTEAQICTNRMDLLNSEGNSEEDIVYRPDPTSKFDLGSIKIIQEKRETGRPILGRPVRICYYFGMITQIYCSEHFSKHIIY